MVRIGLMVAALVLLTAAVYWPVHRFGIIEYDDPVYLYQNPHIQQGLTLAGVKDAFCNLHYENYDPPLATLSFELDQNLWHLRPGPMHVENVLLHLLSGLLLWRLLYVTTGQLNLSFIASAVFLCHPLHVESVAWLAERKDVLSTPILLAAMLAYVRFCRTSCGPLRRDQSEPGRVGPVQARAFGTTGTTRPGSVYCTTRWLMYVLMLLLFATSLFAKAMGVTLPAVLLLMDYWPLRRWPGTSWLKLAIEKLPLVLIAMIVSILQARAQGQIGAFAVAGTLSLTDRINNAIICYVIYLMKLLVPTDLAVFYPHPGTRPMPAVIAAAGLLILITVLCWRQRQRRRFAIVGWLWFIGTLIPVIGLVQIGQQAMADRYSYLPSIGLEIAILWTAATCIRPMAVRWILVVPLITSYALIAHRQVMYWQDTQTLFAHAAEVTDHNNVAYVELGNLAFNHGDLQTAAGEYRLAGDDPHALSGLGNCLLNSDPAQASEFYQAALNHRPNSSIYMMQLAHALRLSGKLPQAEQWAKQAIVIEPDNAAYREELARIRAGDSR